MRRTTWIGLVLLETFALVASLLGPALVIAADPVASPAASESAPTADPASTPADPAPPADPATAPADTAPATVEAPSAAAPEAAPAAETAPAPAEPTPAPTACIPSGTPAISSDKGDYAPGEVVTLTSTGWCPGEAVRVYVNDAGGKTWDLTRDLTADATGAFGLSFTLPTWFVSNYAVKATGTWSGTATTAFTDVSIGTYDQCSNDTGTGYTTGDLGCRWINGNLQANNSRYVEGDATVERLWLTELAPGSAHTVTFKYGTTKGGKHAYDFLTRWDWSENWITVSDRCQGITGCETATDNALAIPVDANANGFDVAANLVKPREFVMRGGALNSATTPAIVSGDYTGDSETAITISFTVGPSSGAMCSTKQGTTTCGVAIWFGAHVATQVNWGLNKGAGAVPGSPYHVSLDAIDNASAGQRDNQMQAGVVTFIPNGTIVIVKDAVPNDPQDFAFNLTNGTTISQDFFLDDDSDATLPNSQTFSVPPGTWAATETKVAGWDLTQLVCSVTGTNGSTYGVDLATAKATITLKSNDTVTCTYTNTNRATIIVKKVAVGGDATFAYTTTGGGGFPAGLNITTSSGSGSQTYSNVTPGAYSVAETPLAGWTLTSSSCTSGTPASFTVPAGGTVTCTFTNTRTYQKDLTVTKTAVASFSRAYHWLIDKSVDHTQLNIPSGTFATFNYGVKVTPDGYADSAWAVAGKITVANPNGFDVAGVNVSDAIDNGGLCTVTGGTNVTVPKNGSVELDYACAYAAAPSPAAGTNTATATWDRATYDTASGSASGTAGVDFSKVTPTETNKTITVVDDKTTPASPVTLGTWNWADGEHTFTYGLDKGGVAGTCTDYTNTAKISETGQSDSQKVTVCVGKDLTVTKTASGTFDRTYGWLIDKRVDQTEIDISAGDTATFHYAVDVTPNGFVDSGWTLGGTITIANPNDWEAITVDVADTLDAGGSCLITETSPYVVPKSGSLTLHYTCTTDGSTATNTATVTWDDAAAATPSSSASDTVDTAFTLDTETNATITVVDDKTDPAHPVTLGTVAWADGATTFQYALDKQGVAGKCTDYTNTAKISETGQSDSQKVTVCVLQPDLTVTKTADAASVSAGDPIGFTITVTNSGPGIARSVSLTDTLPTGTGIDWAVSGTDAGACTITSGVLGCTFGDMAAGASKTVHLTSPTTKDSCATYNNTATATPTNGAAATSPTATVTVLCAQITITKVADAASVSAGDAIGFTITVKNVGLGIARNVTLTDTLPASAGLNWTISPAVSGCSISGGILTCLFGDLAPGASASVHITSPTTAATCGTVSNSASVTTSNDGSASAGDSVIVNCPDLTVTKTADIGTINAGDPAAFKLVVENVGAGTAYNVTLTDVLPGGLAWTIDPAVTGCSITGSTLTCSWATLASGAKVTIVVSAPTSPAVCGKLDNTALVTATNEANTANNSGSASITVNCSDVTVTKEAVSGTINAGDLAAFKVVVTNVGAGTAYNVTLTDLLPAGVTWSMDAAVNGCSISGGTLSCSFASLAAGASVTINVSGQTTAAVCGTLDNTAVVSASNESNTDNNSASASITVNCPDLTVSKTAVTGMIHAGDAAAFKVLLSNIGTGTAYNVTLTDVLPAHVSWAISPAVTGCSISGGTLSCSFATLAAGASVTINVSGTTTPEACGTLNNAVTVTASNEANTANNSASASITVDCPVDLTVSKTAAGSYDRTYLWQISKAVDQTSVSIAEGGSATFHYAVTVTQTGVSDSGWEVLGKITLTNPNDWLDITLTGLSDIVDNGGFCTVDAGPYVVPKGGTLVVNYACAYATAPSSYSGVNTVTATWDASIGTPSGSASFSAPFTLAQAGSTNKTVHVTDSFGGNLGSVVGLDDDPYAKAEFTYERTEAGVAGTCTTYDNTATITETRASSSKSVTVCVGKDLTVSKTASGTFNRAYLWSIAKNVDKTSASIAGGGSATFHYTVDVAQTGISDSGWTLGGKITVSNPNDWEAVTLQSLTDIVSNGGVCTVNPGPYVVPASGSIDVGYTCAYGVAPSSYSGSNTAIAAWDKAAAFTPTGLASGSAGFTLAQAGSTNKTVHVTDSYGGNLGTVTATDAAPFATASFTYDRTESGIAGSCKSYDNTATITETGATASKSVTLCVGKDLTVTKTAVPTMTRKFLWDISKAVDKTTVRQNSGSVTFNYTVIASETGYTDSAWKVTGGITIANPNDWEAITASVSDAVDNGGTCTVYDGATAVTSVTIAKSASKSLTYTCTWASKPSPYAGTNTVTVSWDKDAFATPTGSASGTAGFTFDSGATGNPTNVNKTVTITDTFKGVTTTLGTLTGTTAAPFATKTSTYSRVIDVPPAACVSYTNTATIVETSQSASATVTVCKASLVTDTMHCSLPNSQFKLVFTPDQQAQGAWKLNASNPGQFYYNIFYTGSGNENITVTLPYPFVTQGAVPVHVYSNVGVTTANGITCLTPINELANSAAQVTMASYGDGATPSYNFAKTATITVHVPALTTGFAYIDVHLDYGLKGTTGYAKDGNNNAVKAGTTTPVLIPDLRPYAFSDSAGGATSVTSTNSFKKDPGIGGLVLNATGDAVGNAKVQIFQGTSKTATTTVTTDADGWYMWQFKWTGKAQDFAVKMTPPAPYAATTQSQTVSLKANGYLVVSFSVIK